MPDVGAEDQFETEYTAKFEQLAAKRGLAVAYKKDRAGIDLGLHLYDPTSTSTTSTPLLAIRVWFQFKGKHTSTLSAEALAKAETVSTPVSLENLKFWYALPEPVYIAIYLEATDEFILEDVHHIVERQWGEDFLRPDTFAEGQNEVTVHVRRDAILDEATWQKLTEHRSMRIDGPQWRGRPLGHRFDPLRCEMLPMKPEDYRQLVNRLLEVHGYELIEELDAKALFTDPAADNHAALTLGRLHYTYEWVHPMTTEFGYDVGETFGIEGAPMFAQGLVAVLIHDAVGTAPDQEELHALAQELHERGVEKLLVFTNTDHTPAGFGAYFAGARPLLCVPQDLSSLPFNVLTATSVFLEFRDKIEWKFVHYL